MPRTSGAHRPRLYPHRPDPGRQYPTTIYSAAADSKMRSMAAEFEKLAYEAALRGLDKQEGLLEELRTRTGVLLAASSLAASFLVQQAFRYPTPKAVAVAALAAFVISTGASIFILLPKRSFIFAAAGKDLYEGFYVVRSDMAEVYRRLAYDLHRFWDSNERKVRRLSRVFALAAGSLAVEILALAALLGDSLI